MASLLRKIVERGHCKFIDRADSWQEAVKLSIEPLAATGYVEDGYHRQIVDCIAKYGPYVVYDHYVAMPHSQENAEGVRKTAVGFMRVKEDVDFGADEDGERKIARLFFPLAACDPEEHLDNIMQLMSIFQNEPLLDALLAANTPEDILAAEAKYPPAENEEF